MKIPRVIAFLAAVLALSSSALAETSYPDCEKFDEPLAYNQCLASHGPSAARAMGAPATEAGDTHRPQAFHALRRRGGRMSATFTVH
jgi:hypothetical protein